MNDIVVSQSFTPVEGMTFDIRQLNDGIQIRFRFPNGRGVSVVRHSFSYGADSGLWEAAAIEYNSDEFQNWHFIGLSMNLPGFESDDVRGWLSESDVDEIISMVAALP